MQRYFFVTFSIQKGGCIASIVFFFLHLIAKIVCLKNILYHNYACIDYEKLNHK